MNFIKLLAITVISIFIASCEIINPDEPVPSYISIDSISLITTEAQGPNTQKITDAWIYVNDDPIGCFELPCRVPVLKSGDVKVDIRPGIKINGIGALRTPYPMYLPYIKTINLKEGEITKLTPSTSYDSHFNFEINEQFNISGTIFSKTDYSDTNIIITPSTNPINNGSYGTLKINKEKESFGICTNLNKVIPKTGVPVFIEMDYKCNHPFTVGVYINFANQRTGHSILNINPNTQWNKIYINLTEVATREVNAQSYDLVISSQLIEEQDSAEFNFDNIRLIY